ncbi:MAG: sensor histidine kinase [Planctomycetes bacterium]|nr:sensor histidine kinase [Planctomycetota bacterium]
MRFMRWVTLTWAIPWALASAAAQEPAAATPESPAAPLTTTRQVRLLDSQLAAEGLPARVQGIVTHVDADGTVFFQADGAGTHFRVPDARSTYHPGDRVDVTGVTTPGLYIPGIRPQHVEKLGTAEMPPPIPVTYDDLASGRFHYTWVEVEGPGRSLAVAADETSTLQLGAGARQLEVRIEGLPPEGLVLEDARLRVRGLAAGGINDRRQLVQPYLKANSFRDVQVLEPAAAEPFSQPVTPVKQLFTFNPTGQTSRRVKVAGVVTMPRRGDTFFIRDENDSLAIRAPQSEPFSVGDRIEALGFPEMGTFRAVLADATCRRMGTEAWPEPHHATATTLMTGKHEADLVQVEGVLLVEHNTPDGDVLTLQANQHVFRVHCPNRHSEFPLGSRLSVVGICRVIGSFERGYSAKPTAVEVWTRSADDLRLLSQPSWWTTERLAILLAIVAAAMMLSLFWVALLRQQVRVQMAIIQEQLAREAVRDERQRIAREVHDTLEQELVGLSLRLDAAASVADASQAPVLETMRRLAGRVHGEVRNLVWDLRDTDQTSRTLDEQVAQVVENLRQTTGIEFRVATAGERWTLEPLTQHNVLRIVQEAVTNALKHAAPRCVDISLDYTSQALSVSVRDDGRGFDTLGPDVSKPGHFGLVGMQERARKAGGTLFVESASERGTTIKLMIPRNGHT